MFGGYIMNIKIYVKVFLNKEKTMTNDILALDILMN